MNREVKAWLSSVALAALVAAVTLLLVLPAQAQSITWKVDGPAACTVTCAPAGTPAPTPTPPGPQPGPSEPAPAPPPTDPCAGITDARFNQALAERLDPGGFFWRLGRGLTAQEYACVRARGLPGFGEPPPAPKPPVASAPRTGFVLGIRGAILRNKHPANAASRYVLPNSEKGESVVFTIAENADTQTDAQVTSEVRGPAGELLSGPVTRGSHYTDHRVISPGGVLSLYVTPSLATSLTVQWR